ncbi:TPA: hypothetical protein ONA81_005500 [Pseudomonas aeruginosa]|uniref:hypothetical protein n=1 Tax=Pseudomonas aeruginosa TaxID=287 RepID=UPI0011C3498C|nr:hypothetical protein [Pseudomonas aeruginosa]HBP6080717.1 hypothetical protein [Pseudomonas aeruginosa]HCR1382157.1 hypothetical protein [Pseudomonas aeruginosa]HCR1589523.1 hypothetical protein [Pseudomonas aeruginosa]
MAEGKEEPTFASFKGLGYVSMFMGVPLGPLLILFGIGVFGGLILFLTVGAWGLLCPVLCGAVLMFLKVLCETDNKAMEHAKWSWKAWFWRLRRGSSILIVSPNQPGSKNEHFFARLKKIHRTG